jgi:hypothetical protein
LSGDFTKGLFWTWTSATVKRVVRSTLAAEAYAVSEATETGQMLRQLLVEIRCHSKPKQLEVDAQKHPLIVCTDSGNLSKTVPKDTSTVADKRLRIVITMLRDVFLGVENTVLRWVPTRLMLADNLTKSTKLSLIHALMSSTKFVCDDPHDVDVVSVVDDEVDESWDLGLTLSVLFVLFSVLGFITFCRWILSWYCFLFVRPVAGGVLAITAIDRWRRLVRRLFRIRRLQRLFAYLGHLLQCVLPVPSTVRASLLSGFKLQ